MSVNSLIMSSTPGLHEEIFSSYLFPKQLDEQVSALHFPALGTVLAVFAVEHQCVCCQVQGPFQAYRSRFTSYQRLYEEVAIGPFWNRCGSHGICSFRYAEVLLQISFACKDTESFPCG